MLMQPRRRARSRGLSVIELMVGVAIGMIVVGAALQLFAQNVVTSRRMVLDTRVNQDLRALGDLITRDLRRAGYWDNAIKGTIAVGTGAATTANPYAGVATASSEITYAFTRDATENDTLNDNEHFGFRRTSSGAVEMQTANGTWQTVTDPGATKVTALTITPTETELHLGNLCPKTCAVGTPNCPKMKVRHYDLTISGESARDSSVKRQLKSSVRVRADQFEGECPP